MRNATLLCLLLPVVGCAKGESAAGGPSVARPTPLVVVAPVLVQDVPVIREFVARTEARETVVITARVEAVLQSREFEEGQPVEKGQVLYRLDAETYEANLSAALAREAKAAADLKLAEEQVTVREAEAALLQAKAARKKAQQDVARLRPLAEQDAVPRQDLDTALAAEEVTEAQVQATEAMLQNARILEEVGVMQAKAQLQSAESAVRLARLDLDYCTIRSPIAGLIGRTMIDAGNLVGRVGVTELATVSSIDPMLVTLAISEAEYLTLQRGRPPGEEKPDLEIELILADDSVYEHTGRFLTAERAVALETGTLQVVTEFPNPEGLLRPGQFARTRSAVSTLEGAVLVPQRAVMEQQSAKIVLVVDAEGTVALRTVQLAQRFGGSYVVLDGLTGGEQVIVEGQMKARPGSKVKVTDRPVSAEPSAAGAAAAAATKDG